MTPRASAIARTFQAAFAELSDHARVSHGEASEIAAMVTAHVRSAFPMAAMIDTGPVAKVEPVAALERDLGEGAKYRLATEAGCVVLDLRDPHDGAALVAMTPVQVLRLRADLADVASGVTP